MAKHVVKRPEWLDAEKVVDIYSVSGCFSGDFAEYINYWRHNGYWLFDSPQVIREVAALAKSDLSRTKLFYYEVFEQEYTEEAEQPWSVFSPEPSFVTNILAPAAKVLEGFDVVTFWAKTNPEHSPLSCNSLANTIPTNQHCLLADLDTAKRLLESGAFFGSEPGPRRIFAVYSIEW